jgi:hypothetical protein
VPDYSQPYGNGWIDPADVSAGELATWWDRRVEQRRVANTELIHGEAITTVVERLEVLSRADELSSPRPGFLDHLESQIMQTSPGALPVVPSSARRDPAVPPVPRLGPPRRSRGLIDILSVAAVLALLLGGSWAVWNGTTTAPTPGGLNGVVGVSTPDDSAARRNGLVGVAVLDQPWIENEPGLSIDGVLPVSTTECVTPSRSAGSVEASVEERRVLGDAAPTIEPDLLPGSGINPSNYPPASEEEVNAMKAFFRQLSACRFETGEWNGTQLLPYTGAYWNLYADEAFDFDGATTINRPVAEVVQERYSSESSYVLQWSYPATVLNVRQVSPDNDGRRRLLVTTSGSTARTGETSSLMVQDGGQWRFLVADLAPPAYRVPAAAQVVDILLGRDGDSPRGSGNRDIQLEADFPVAMTIANVGQTPHRVIVAGQDLGIVAPDGAVVIQPFKVRPEAVEEADGYLAFAVESVDPVGTPPDSPVTRSMTIAVYRTGSLFYAPDEAGRATPEVLGGSDATPTGPTATPDTPPASTTQTPVSVAVSAEADRVAELDQPWAENLPDDALGSATAVNAADCTTPSRPAGSIAADVAQRDTLGDAAPTIEPEFVPDSGIDPADYPVGSAADLTDATAFFRQVSACRFATGDRSGTALLPFTGAYWNLYSADAFYFGHRFPDDQTAKEAVDQQGLYLSQFVDGWSYPATVTDVRDVSPDALGQRRLLISTVGLDSRQPTTLSLLVQEDGQWRFLVPSLRQPDPSAERAAQVVDVRLGLDAYGPRATGNFPGRVEAEAPITMTIANVGHTPQRVKVDGQDIGVIQPGASAVFQPFQVRSGAVADAGGRFTFSIESTDLGVAADVSAARPLAIAVYPPGSLEPNGSFVDAATPAIEGTPGGR